MRKLTYTVKEAKEILSISHCKIYEEINAGRLDAKKSGRKTLIPHDSLENWLKNLVSYQPTKKS